MRELREPRDVTVSALSNGPYMRTLAYWFKKLRGRPGRGRFLATKTVEMAAFHSVRPSFHSVKAMPCRFPDPLLNCVPDRPVVAVVVPAYLRRTEDQAQLRRLLSEIREQSVRPHLVIVVDDCSPTQVVVTEGSLIGIRNPP